MLCFSVLFKMTFEEPNPIKFWLKNVQVILIIIRLEPYLVFVWFCVQFYKNENKKSIC